MKKRVVAAFVLLVVASCLMAKANQDQSDQDESEHPSKAQTGQVTVQGCVSHSNSGHYILTESRGHSYVLHASGNINIGQYIGQQVEVAGSESPTFSTSSTATRSGAASPAVTIMLDSINTISKRCAH
jgi:hypothetical protein